MDNFKRIVSSQNLWPAAIGSATAGLSAFADDEALDSASGEEDGFNEAADIFGHAGVQGAAIGGLLLAGRSSGDPKFRRASYELAQGFVVNGAITLGLKGAISRRRPNGENTNSFPSGHASTAFTSATILSEHYGLKAGVPAYLTAGFIGWTRLDRKEHNLSDVLAGAALGYVVGKTVTRDRRFLGGRRVQWSVGPAAGGGAAVSVNISLARRP